MYHRLNLPELPVDPRFMHLFIIAALEECTNKIDIEGGGVNPLAIKSFMTAVLSEIEDSDYKVKP